MKDALPYYRWHWRDYRSNRKVQRMDYIARGLYRELLDECWAEGFIPDDIDRLAEICGCPKRTLEERWHSLSVCFVEIGPGKLVNERMNEERTEKDSHRVKCAIAGGYGGRAKIESERTLANASERQEPASERHIALAVARAEQEQSAPALEDFIARARAIGEPKEQFRDYKAISVEHAFVDEVKSGADPAEIVMALCRIHRWTENGKFAPRLHEVIRRWSESQDKWERTDRDKTTGKRGAIPPMPMASAAAKMRLQLEAD